MSLCEIVIHVIGASFCAGIVAFTVWVAVTALKDYGKKP
jgi:hypothetical protein